MARINVEEEWFSDLRRSRLITLLGQGDAYADGVAIAAWKLAQQYWLKDKELIPEHAWKACLMPDALFEAGLAERRKGGIYVRGSDRNFEWYFKKTANLTVGAVAGGKKRVRTASRNEKGRFISNTIQPEDQPTSSLSSPSSSSSSSSSKKETTIAHLKKNERVSFDLEFLYQQYPRKVGKTPGLKKLAKDIKTVEDLSLLETAIKNHNEFLRREKRPVEKTPYFSTFATNWRDWINPDPKIYSRQEYTGIVEE